MEVIEISSFSGTQYINSETGKPLSPSEVVEYKKEKKQNENKFTRLDELAHEWNKNCKKKVPYEFIEWLKMVY